MNTSQGIAIGVYSVRAEAMDNNRIQGFLPGNPDTIARLATSPSGSVDSQSILQDMVETNHYKSNLPSSVWVRATYIHNGYFQLPAFSCLQVVDQICSYRFILY